MSLLRDEEGSAQIELAVFVSLMVLMFAGVVDYGLEIQQAIQVQDAAAAGASFGAIPGNESNLAGIVTAANAAAPRVHGFQATASDVWACTAGGAAISSGTTCPGGLTPYKYVVVQTSATIPMLLAYPGMPASLALHGAARFPVPWSQ